MAVAFSRLQLAAALLEYDNDPLDPEAPVRSAAESAIFAQFHRNERPRSTVSRKSVDHLGVALPSDRGSVAGRESIMDSGDKRRSQSSIDMLRNPFGATQEDLLEEEEMEEEREVEVDLQSWGLDGFLAKDKDKGKDPQNQGALPNPHGPSGSKRPHYKSAPSRAMSLGNYDDFGVGGAFLDAKSISLPLAPDPRFRRNSFGSPLDLVGIQPSEDQIPRSFRQLTHAAIESLPVTPPLHAVPFPTSPMDDTVDNRSSLYLDSRPHQRTFSTVSGGSRMLNDDPARPHQRTFSTVSGGSRMLNDDPANYMSPPRRSRFDSRGNRILTTSTMEPARSSDENNPFSVRPPSPSRSSRFDPKAAAHARTISNASLGSRMLDDVPSGTGAAQFSSRLDLLRPRVLIMPSPLQKTEAPPPPAPKIREGFHITTDGTPLPAGARAAPKSAVLMPVQPQGSVPSNPFISNPRSSLTLAQLTFRSTLHDNVGYSEIEGGLRRATEEGEQVQQPPSPVDVGAPATNLDMQAGNRNSRGPGKVLGRSLIDDIEIRKAEMRGKQRVFRGDERPSMMARSSTYSTLIDPALLQRSDTQQLDAGASGAPLVRRRTLLNLDEQKDDGKNLDPRKSQMALGNRASNVKTVFGRDTLWEREMTRLREMEALERSQSGENLEQIPPSPSVDIDKESQPLASPTRKLPDFVKRGPPPRVTDDDDDEDSDSDASDVPKQVQSSKNNDGEWFSDEEKAGPVRTVGSGPRYPKGKGKTKVTSKSIPVPQTQDDNDSEEDVPLVATISRAVQRATRLGMLDDEDSDEDRPLTTLLDKTKLKPQSMDLEPLSGTKSTEDAKDEDEDEDEDDVPLGLRASRVVGDEDDVPLAFHPDQQRRTQYQMMLQQQHRQQQQFAQQQQMMIQAQFQNSMMFPPQTMMGSTFFPPPMAMQPMMPSLMGISTTPPPASDANKLGRVDRWRREVAVEGEPA